MDSGPGPPGRPGMTTTMTCAFADDNGKPRNDERSLPHESRQYEIDDRVNLALGQAGRVRIGRHLVAELRGGEPIAVLVLVGVFIEVRHFRAGAAAGDHLDQLLAVEAGLVQIRRLAGGTR